MRLHILHFINSIECPLLHYIRNGEKTVEGRKNSKKYSKIQIGDIIMFKTHCEINTFVQVKYINKYRTLDEYLEKETVKKTVPCAKSIEEAKDIYYQWNSKEKLDQMEFLGIGIKLLKSFKNNVQEPWFSFIASGKKIAEGRLNKGKFKEMKKGDIAVWSNKNKKVITYITGNNKYKTFYEMLDQEGLCNVLPNKDTLEDGVQVYRQWYNEERESIFGVAAIKLKVLSINK